MYLLFSCAIRLFIEFQRKYTSLKSSMSSLFSASPGSLKGESCKYSLDDNDLNLQYTNYWFPFRETNKNFVAISKYVKLQIYSKHKMNNNLVTESGQNSECLKIKTIKVH